MNTNFTESKIHFLVEGLTDAVVAQRLLKHVRLEPGNFFGGKGKAHLLAHLPRYNQAARNGSIWFALIDLDNEVCASQAITKWLPEREEGMVLRVVVKAVEAWLMADSERMAEFLHVPLSKFPDNPDGEINPKEKLISIARSSTNNNVRNGFVPRQRSGAHEGPLYPVRLNEFTQKYWRPEEAMLRSDSLRRCINALSTVKGTISEW